MKKRPKSSLDSSTTPDLMSPYGTSVECPDAKPKTVDGIIQPSEFAQNRENKKGQGSE